MLKGARFGMIEILREDEKEVVEGSASILTTETVFFNTVQEFSRDLSIAVLTAYAEVCARVDKPKHGRRAFDGLTIFDALSATGVRSVRYAKEVPGVHSITANDIDMKAARYIQKNIERNGVENMVTAKHADAIEFLHSQKRQIYNVIDLDPYGCPSRFLDSAVMSIRDGGLLLVTATDMAVLSGNAPESCYNKYGAISLKTRSCHEMALRILLHSIAGHAARHGRYIVPLLSTSVDFYIRVFVRVYTGARHCKYTLSKLSMVKNCTGCGSFELQPLGMIKQAPNERDKFALPTNQSKGKFMKYCPHCKHSYHTGGPIWSAPIHDKSFVGAVLALAPKTLNTYKRIFGMLNVILEELHDAPLYHPIDKLSGTLHCETPKLLSLTSAFMHAGYKVSSTHCHKSAIKTNAPANVIWKIMRSWVNNHPVAEKWLQEDQVTANLLNRSRTEAYRFDIHPNANPESRRRGYMRFQENPTAFWGPGTRGTAMSAYRAGAPGGQKRKAVSVETGAVRLNEAGDARPIEMANVARSSASSMKVASGPLAVGPATSTVAQTGAKIKIDATDGTIEVVDLAGPPTSTIAQTAVKIKVEPAAAAMEVDDLPGLLDIAREMAGRIKIEPVTDHPEFVEPAAPSSIDIAHMVSKIKVEPGAGTMEVVDLAGPPISTIAQTAVKIKVEPAAAAMEVDDLAGLRDIAREMAGRIKIEPVTDHPEFVAPAAPSSIDIAHMVSKIKVEPGAETMGVVDLTGPPTSTIAQTAVKIKVEPAAAAMEVDDLAGLRGKAIKIEPVTDGCEYVEEVDPSSIDFASVASKIKVEPGAGTMEVVDLVGPPTSKIAQTAREIKVESARSTIEVIDLPESPKVKPAASTIEVIDLVRPPTIGTRRPGTEMMVESAAAPIEIIDIADTPTSDCGHTAGQNRMKPKQSNVEHRTGLSASGFRRIIPRAASAEQRADPAGRAAHGFRTTVNPHSIDHNAGHSTATILFPRVSTFPGPNYDERTAAIIRNPSLAFASSPDRLPPERLAARMHDTETRKPSSFEYRTGQFVSDVALTGRPMNNPDTSRPNQMADLSGRCGPNYRVPTAQVPNQPAAGQVGNSGTVNPRGRSGATICFPRASTFPGPNYDERTAAIIRNPSLAFASSPDRLPPELAAAQRRDKEIRYSFVATPTSGQSASSAWHPLNPDAAYVKPIIDPATMAALEIRRTFSEKAKKTVAGEMSKKDAAGKIPKKATGQTRRIYAPDKIKKKHAAEKIPTKDPAGETSKKDDVNKIPTNDAAGETPEQDVAEEIPMNAASNETPKKDAADKIAMNDAEDAIAKEDAAEDAIAKEDAAEDAIAKEDAAEDAIAKEDAAEDAIAKEDAAEDAIAKEDAAEDAIAKEDAAEDTIAKEDAAEDIPINVVADETPKKDDVDKIPANDASDEIAKEDASDEIAKEDASDEIAKEDASDEIAKDDASDEIAKEDASDEIAKDDASDEIAKEDASDEIAKEDASGEIPKEEAATCQIECTGSHNSGEEPIGQYAIVEHKQDKDNLHCSINEKKSLPSKTEDAGNQSKCKEDVDRTVSMHDMTLSADKGAPGQTIGEAEESPGQTHQQEKRKLEDAEPTSAKKAHKDETTDDSL